LDIETIKRHPDVFRLYASRVSVRKSGSGWVGHCPLHSDNRESLSLYWSDDGVLLWKCHSEHKEGNIVQFISELERVSIAKAAKKAEEELKSSWSEEKQRVDAAFRPVPAGSKNYKTFPLANYGRLKQILKKAQRLWPIWRAEESRLRPLKSCISAL
jgi:DNA primase